MNKSPLKSITVQWYEGFQFRDTPFTVYTWKELDDFLLRVYDERVKEVGESNIHIGGYSKVKVRIEWKNGDYLEDRIDVGGSIGDYASRRDSPIGDYLKGPGVGGKPRSAMYGSSFQYDTDDGTTTGIVTETSRDDVMWNDDEGLEREMEGGDVGILVSFPEDDRETMANERSLADQYSVDLSLYSASEIGGSIPGNMYEAQGDKQSLSNWLFYHLDYELDEIKRIWPGLFAGVHPAHTDEDWYSYV